MDCPSDRAVSYRYELSQEGEVSEPAARLCIEPECGRAIRSSRHRRCEQHRRATPTTDTCQAQDCVMPAARSRLCWGHLKRRARGQDINVLLVDKPGDPWRVLMEGVFEFCDLRATDDEGWKRAEARLKMAILRYTRSIGARK